MPGTLFGVEVQPTIPAKISRLKELANDLYFSWDRSVRRLFSHLDLQTWLSCNSNPKVFLRRVSQQTLDNAANDPIFLAEYSRVLSVYDTYMVEQPLTRIEYGRDAGEGLIAYFSFEFGLHQSVPIYAGGLGILAGDYCKAMSNLWMPFVGIGLLYREGYFTQRILCSGEQQEDYPHVDPADLPVIAITDAQGKEKRVDVDLPGRRVYLRIWEAKVGHIRLLLLDSDVEENSSQDRAITYKLYGGGTEERIQQEMVLGIGGTRALRALGKSPWVWHINEGHAGFLIAERCREYIAQGHDFSTALVMTSANTVFTTHTPVPAGHDIFDRALVLRYFHDYFTDSGNAMENFLALGESPGHPEGFNMTALGLRGSDFANGVSRIHGRVASEMEAHVWPQIPPEENPITYVTNGVDAETFLGQSWISLFEMYAGRGWRAKLTDDLFWRRFIDDIPDHAYNSVREIQKAEMLEDMRRRAEVQFRRDGGNETIVREITHLLDPKRLNTLVIGFARRFATYKRATLLFRDLPRLARLVNDPEHPVLFLFAGKAHPNDTPGKQLIREIVQISLRPEFRGKILLLEDYNLSMGRKLYSGVDVWLNVPEYPKEACGTSGMKAGLNGAVNLSILDGWWDEAYDGTNGWAITPSHEQDPESRDQKESVELMNILEQEVVPLFFKEDKKEWVARSKASMKSILPRFNSIRMAKDYINNLYLPARRHGTEIHKDKGASAKALAAWMEKLRRTWPGVKARLNADLPGSVQTGHPYPIEVAVDLNGLTTDDIVVECVLGQLDALGRFTASQILPFEPEKNLPGTGEAVFHLDLCKTYKPHPLAGLEHFKIRLYPYHPLLSHPFACGCMIWL